MLNRVIEMSNCNLMKCRPLLKSKSCETKITAVWNWQHWRTRCWQFHTAVILVSQDLDFRRGRHFIRIQFDISMTRFSMFRLFGRYWFPFAAEVQNRSELPGK